MVKAKQRKPAISLENISGEMDICGDNSWVVVKKQTVTILLPPLPAQGLTPSKPSPLEDLAETTVSRKCQEPIKHASELDKNVASSLHPSEMDKLLKTSSRVIKQMGGFNRPSCTLPTVDILVKQRLRARNLEMKLNRAGGLSRWLISLGLGQFVRMFQSRGVNKFQLAGLTMQKLKDMGAAPVGPRRKLIHAIDCCCEPYCF